MLSSMLLVCGNLQSIQMLLFFSLTWLGASALPLPAPCIVPDIPDGVDTWSSCQNGGLVEQGVDCQITAKAGYTCTSPGVCGPAGFANVGSCKARFTLPEDMPLSRALGPGVATCMVPPLLAHEASYAESWCRQGMVSEGMVCTIYAAPGYMCASPGECLSLGTFATENAKCQADTCNQCYKPTGGIGFAVMGQPPCVQMSDVNTYCDGCVVDPMAGSHCPDKNNPCLGDICKALRAPTCADCWVQYGGNECVRKSDNTAGPECTHCSINSVSPSSLHCSSYTCVGNTCQALATMTTVLVDEEFKSCGGAPIHNYGTGMSAGFCAQLCIDDATCNYVGYRHDNKECGKWDTCQIDDSTPHQWTVYKALPATMRVLVNGSTKCVGMAGPALGTSTSANACAQKCAEDRTCYYVEYAWDSGACTKYGNCILFEQIGGSGWTVYMVDIAGYTRVRGLRRNDGTLGAVTATTVMECVDACNANVDCVAFHMNLLSVDSCELKSPGFGADNQISDADYDSYWKASYTLPKCSAVFFDETGTGHTIADTAQSPAKGGTFQILYIIGDSIKMVGMDSTGLAIHARTMPTSVCGLSTVNPAATWRSSAVDLCVLAGWSTAQTAGSSYSRNTESCEAPLDPVPAPAAPTVASASLLAQGKWCGVSGNGAVVCTGCSGVTVHQAGDCRNLCYEKDSCLYFSWNSNSKGCSRFSECGVPTEDPYNNGADSTHMLTYAKAYTEYIFIPGKAYFDNNDLIAEVTNLLEPGCEDACNADSNCLGFHYLHYRRCKLQKAWTPTNDDTGSTYVKKAAPFWLKHIDTWCGDTVLAQNWKDLSRAQCESWCASNPVCNFIVFGFDTDSMTNLCALFTTCNQLYTYQTGDPNVYSKDAPLWPLRWPNSRCTGEVGHKVASHRECQELAANNGQSSFGFATMTSGDFLCATNVACRLAEANWDSNWNWNIYHQAIFIVGDDATDACPIGSLMITTYDECEAASDEIGLNFKGNENAANRPKGCNVMGGDKAYWNTHATGNAFSERQPLCRVQAFGIRLGLPQKHNMDVEYEHSPVLGFHGLISTEPECQQAALIHGVSFGGVEQIPIEHGVPPGCWSSHGLSGVVLFYFNSAVTTDNTVVNNTVSAVYKTEAVYKVVKASCQVAECEAEATCPTGFFLRRCSLEPFNKGMGMLTTTDSCKTKGEDTVPVTVVATCSTAQIAIEESGSVSGDGVTAQDVSASCVDGRVPLSCYCYSSAGLCRDHLSDPSSFAPVGSTCTKSIVLPVEVDGAKVFALCEPVVCTYVISWLAQGENMGGIITYHGPRGISFDDFDTCVDTAFVLANPGTKAHGVAYCENQFGLQLRVLRRKDNNEIVGEGGCCRIETVPRQINITSVCDDGLYAPVQTEGTAGEVTEEGTEDEEEEEEEGDSSTTTTTTTIMSLAGSIVFDVNDRTSFVEVPNIEEVMAIAIAELLDVILSWIHNVTVSLEDRRRLEQSLRGRQLEDGDPTFSTQTRGGVKIDFRVVIPPDSKENEVLITPTIIMDRFDKVALEEATEVIDKVIASNLFTGGESYNVKVRYKVIKKEQPDDPAPAPAPDDSSSGVLIAIAGAAAGLALISMIATLACCYRLRRKRSLESQSLLKARLAAANESKSLSQFLFPPVAITLDHRNMLQSFLEGLLDASDAKVFIIFAMDKRPEDVDNCCPGAFYAAAVAQSLNAHSIKCYMSLPGLTSGESCQQLLSEAMPSCRNAVIIETPALFDCSKCFRDIHLAQDKGMEIIRFRFEASLPNNSDWWPDIQDEPSKLSIVRSRLKDSAEQPEAPDIVPMNPEALEVYSHELKLKLSVGISPQYQALAHGSRKSKDSCASVAAVGINMEHSFTGRTSSSASERGSKENDALTRNPSVLEKVRQSLSDMTSTSSILPNRKAPRRTQSEGSSVASKKVKRVKSVPRNKSIDRTASESISPQRSEKPKKAHNTAPPALDGQSFGKVQTDGGDKKNQRSDSRGRNKSADGNGVIKTKSSEPTGSKTVKPRRAG